MKFLRLLLCTSALPACTAALQAPASGGSGGSSVPTANHEKPTQVTLSLLSPASFAGAASVKSGVAWSVENAVQSTTTVTLPVQTNILSLSGSPITSLTGSGSNPSSGPSITSQIQSPTSLWEADPSSVAFEAKLEASFPQNTHGLCEWLAPLDSLSCFPSASFQFSLADWSGRLELQGAASTVESLGDTNDKALSNKLPALDHWVFEQVSDTAGDANAHDGAFILKARPGNRLLVLSNDAQGKHKLYAIDDSGSRRISNLSTSDSTLDAINVDTPVAYHGKVYFTAETAPFSMSYRLWRTDGDLLEQIDLGAATKVILGPSFNDQLYFIHNAVSSHYKLFRLNDTGIEQITDTLSGSDDFTAGTTCSDYCLNPTMSRFLVRGQSLFFTPNINATGPGLVELNGSNLFQRSRFNGASGDFSINFEADPLLVDSGTSFKIFLTGKSGLNQRSMVYDGAQVTQLSSFNTSATPFMALGSEVYFSAQPQTNVYHLYKSDGTSFDLAAVTSGSFTVTSNPSVLAVFKGWLYFSSQDSSGRVRLYRTQDTTVEQITQLNAAGNDLLGPQTPLELDGKLYLVLYNSQGKTKIFRTDGSSLEQFSNLNGDTQDDVAYNDDSSGNSSEYRFEVLGDYVYFPGYNSLHKTKLMRFRWR